MRSNLNSRRLPKTLCSAMVATIGAVAPHAFAGVVVNSVPGNAQLSFPLDTSSPAFDNAAFPNADFRPDAGGTDYLSKYTWYYRTPARRGTFLNPVPMGNNPLSFPSVPTQSPSGATVNGPVTLTWTNAGVADVAGQSALFNATMTMTVTDGPTPGSANVLTRLQFASASSNNSSVRAYNLFAYIDPIFILGDRVGMTFSGTQSAGTVTGTWTQPSAAGQSFNLLATGNPVVQVGESSNTTVGAPLNAITGGQTTPLLLGNTSDLSSTALNYTTTGGLGVGVGLQWTFNLAGGQSAPDVFVAFAVNQPAAIPEPAALIGLGSLGVAALRRRSR